MNISGLPQTDTANDSLFKGFIHDDGTFSSDGSQFSMEGGESPKLNYMKRMGMWFTLEYNHISDHK